MAYDNIFYVGAFIYYEPTDQIYWDPSDVHYNIIENYIGDDQPLRNNYAAGWLYEHKAELDEPLYVQWSSIEYSIGTKALREKAEVALSREFDGRQVIETEGRSQWDDGETYAKVASTIPVEVIDIDVAEVGLDWHGGGWPWVYGREMNLICIANREVYHFDFFDQMEEHEDEAHLLAQQYLGTDKSKLADFVIGRYEPGYGIGTISYRGTEEEEAAIAEALDSVKGQLIDGDWSRNGDLDIFGKTAADVPNRARGAWPAGYGWATSWLYLPETDEVLISESPRQNHEDTIEEHEGDTGQEVNLNQAYEVGLLLEKQDTGEYFIYPEYSDWDRYQRDGVPFSENHVLERVKETAESKDWNPIVGVIRGDEHGTPEITAISKFRPKKPRRHHVRKREHEHFHSYDGIMVFIPSWCPPIHPEGGQVDTTAKTSVQIPVLIKFVSLPDKFLVGEDTHHLYLLEAEYGTGIFPAETEAIGRASLEKDMITGIGFDFGTPSAQDHAIQQLTEWAHKQGYEVAPGLKLQIPGLAEVS